MAGMAFDHQLSFDPFAMSALDSQLNSSDFSPIGLFNPLEDFSNTDLTSDSAPSPGSPMSPNLATSYALPTADDWMAWDKLDQSPEPDFLKTEPFEDTVLESLPVQKSVPLSPAVNPMHLANAGLENVTPGQEGINDQQTSSRGGKRYPSRGLKRKSCCSSEDDDGSQTSSTSPPPALRRSSTKESVKSELGPKKTAHNMIEKRYRTNINDKIAALRDSVPALRVMVHKLEHQGSDDDADEDSFPAFGQSRPEDLGGLQPAHKLNKATILSKATEYIAHLERRNKNLAKENSNLRGKVDGFEMIIMGRHAQTAPIWA